MLKKIAITGGIATGKTQVLKIFKKLGSYTVSSDKIVHTLLNKNKDIKLQIIDNFGKEILDKGKINKKKLAKIVFNDKKKLALLEKIIHPQVIKEIENEYEKVKNENFNFFVVEVPLLFEIGFQKYFDIVITISTKEEIAKKRYKYKDYINRKKRLMSLKEKENLSDFIITNNQTISNLKDKIIKLSKIIKNL